MITALGRLLSDGGSRHPQQLLERARQPGRSAGALARTLEEFLVAQGLAFGLGEEARLALGRRQRRIEATPPALRPAVGSFCEHLIRSRERARRAGTRPRCDITIESALSLVRDFGRFLVADRDKNDWAAVQNTDIELFLTLQPANRQRRLGTLRQFFAWARKNKIVLTDPTDGQPSISRRGFTGKTLTVAEQRRLFRRWTTDPEVHPNEATVGILALLHALSTGEIRHLHADHLDQRARTFRVEGRPHPVPLDPVTLNAVQRCLAHRAATGTRNPHLIVTVITKTRSTPASRAYIGHILNPAGVTPKIVRSTRLVDLVISLDPKIVAESLGMNAGGLVKYLGDHIDPGLREHSMSTNV